MEHSIAKAGEAREAVIAERYELAIHGKAIRQAGQFGNEAGHVPAAATPDVKVTVPRHECAEAIPFGFVGVVAARWQTPGTSNIGSGSRGSIGSGSRTAAQVYLR